MMKHVLSIALATLLFTSTLAQADEWYEGGTLAEANGQEWADASDENKLASAGAYLKDKYDHREDQLRRDGIEVSSVDELRPYAESLVTHTDEVLGYTSESGWNQMDNLLHVGYLMLWDRLKPE